MSESHADYYERHAATVTDTEDSILRRHEPDINFKYATDTDIFLSQGRQSRVSVLEYEQGGEQYRVLWKRMGVNKGLTEEETGVFNARLEPYREALIAAGWNVPKLLYTRVTELPDGYQIFSYEQYIAGGDGKKLFGNPNEPSFRKWYLMNEIVRTLYRYPEGMLQRQAVGGHTVTRLPHGLDLKLANVVLEAGSNHLYFVDLFGPKELDERGAWLTYSPKLDSLSEENLMAVCATREGAILRCWRLAEQHWRGGHKSADDLRGEFLARLHNQSGLPPEEVTFIAEQVTSGYPWLDNLYRESQV